MGSLHHGLGSDSVAYRLSKLALNGLTISLAQSLRGTAVLVNSVDPGWVRTAMGGPMAHKTVEEGARGIVHAVLLPDRGPTGAFLRDGRRLEWYLSVVRSVVRCFRMGAAYPVKRLKCETTDN